MNCTEANNLKDAYLDGELDAMHSGDMEAHLKSCPNCSAARSNLENLRAAMRSDEMYFRAPTRLQRQIRSALRFDEEPATPVASWLQQFWFKFAAVSLVTALLAWLVALQLNVRSSTDRLAEEITSGHVRSLMAGHLTDVASSDGHTVKPWFIGRLDYGVTVVDTTEHGFPLIGGRLDYIRGRQVAALVYQRKKHVINLFTWPDALETAESERASSYHGYNLVHWCASGMEFWAVSDLNRGELGDFAQLIKEQTPTAPKP
jgi:anti-sigma factor RsiW